MNNKLQAQIEIVKRLENYFKVMADNQGKQATKEQDGSRDEAFHKGAWAAYAMAENECKNFIAAVEAEQAGLGVVVWTDKGCKLITDKEK